MRTPAAKRMEQLVDWSAAVQAGLIAGTLFLLINVFVLPMFIGGNGWVIIRLFASIPLGPEVLAPPADYALKPLLAALGTHYALSIGFALLVSAIIHRGGLLGGILFGAVLGLALYWINFFALTYFFEWFFAMKGPFFMASHILFGAMVGGIYEGLEVEEFVPADGGAA